MTPQFLFSVAFLGVAWATLPSEFQTLSASQKVDLLMKNINETPYEDLPTDDFKMTTKIKILLPTFLVKAFTWTGDEMIEDRPKLIHTYGSCVRASLEIFDNSTFTGIFKAGSKSDAIARLSLATTDVKNKYTPGMAIKIPVDKAPSHSLITMFSVEGQGNDKNFFAHTFTNQIPDGHGAGARFIGFQFRLALGLLPGKDCAKPVDEGKLPLFVPASVEQNGKIVASPKVPEVINFIPTEAVGWSKDNPEDTRTLLAETPPGTVLYYLAVKASRDAKESTIIGQLVTKSKFVASDYCDSKLYFQHHAKRC